MCATGGRVAVRTGCRDRACSVLRTSWLGPQPGPPGPKTRTCQVERRNKRRHQQAADNAPEPDPLLLLPAALAPSLTRVGAVAGAGVRLDGLAAQARRARCVRLLGGRGRGAGGGRVGRRLMRVGGGHADLRRRRDECWGGRGRGKVRTGWTGGGVSFRLARARIGGHKSPPSPASPASHPTLSPQSPPTG